VLLLLLLFSSVSGPGLEVAKSRDVERCCDCFV
jgi:hypothetical protein